MLDADAEGAVARIVLQLIERGTSFADTGHTPHRHRA
jgi:hypothetical protein